MGSLVQLQPELWGRPSEPDSSLRPAPTPGPGGLLRGASGPGGGLPGLVVPRYLSGMGAGGKEQRQESCRRLYGERGWGGQPTRLSARPAPSHSDRLQLH